MTRTTFEGRDYVPHVIDDWLVPSSGVVLVATIEESRDQIAPRDVNGNVLHVGHVVAMTRVTMLAARDAWLEGIRVDPACRGMDVATDLQVAELYWIVAHGGSVVRYLANETNVGSQRLGRRHGLNEVGRWRSRVREDAGDQAKTDGPARTEGVLPGVASDWDCLTEDPLFTSAHGLYEWRSWAFQELTRERFARHVQRGEVFVGLDDGGHRSALAIIGESKGESGESGDRHAALVAGEPGALTSLLNQLGGPELRVPDPLPASRAELEPLMEDLGYVQWPRAAVIVERRIDAANPLPAIDSGRLRLIDEPKAIATPVTL
jgi:hypothetical protein